MGALLEAIFPLFRRFAVEIILLTVAVGIAAASFVYIFPPSDSLPAEMESAPSATAGKTQPLMVEVAGAVNEAGVYEMRPGSRLKDALTQAGGLSDEADFEYFHRNFNQARYVADQEKIYVPTAQEVTEGIFTERKQNADYLTPQTSSATSTTGGGATVSINTAETAELESLPGVGKATAAKIIQMRPYANVDELLGKQAVKKSVFEQIKNLVSL